MNVYSIVYNKTKIGKPLFKIYIFKTFIVIPILTSSIYASELLENDGFNDYNENLRTPWIEQEIIINEPPQENDLVEVSLDRLPANIKLFVDIKNLHIGEDFVTRGWIVAKSSSNAYNGSYEGFRCATQEYKVYAFFNPKRSTPLRLRRSSNWKKIRQGSYRAEFMEHIICNRLAVEPIDRIKDNLDKEYDAYRQP